MVVDPQQGHIFKNHHFYTSVVTLVGQGDSISYVIMSKCLKPSELAFTQDYRFQYR